MTIMTCTEARQKEREMQSQELQDRLVVKLKLEDEKKRTFDKVKEEYEHMLMDLQEHSWMKESG